MIKYISAVCLLLISTCLAQAQKANSKSKPTIPVIETDRPDQTETPYLTAEKHLQFEWGITHTQVDKNSSEFLSPTLLSKYAFNSNFEIRLITELSTLKDKTINSSITGLAPVQIGGKIRLAEEHSWLPKTSLIFHFALPKLASKNLRANKVAPNFRFVMQNTISNKVALGYNIGAEWDGYSDRPTYIYTFAPGFNLSDRLYYYIEAFGFIPSTTGEFAQHSMDMGFAYKLNNDVKFDVSGGVGLNKYTPSWYVAVGGSLRIDLKSE